VVADAAIPIVKLEFLSVCEIITPKEVLAAALKSGAIVVVVAVVMF